MIAIIDYKVGNLGNLKNALDTQNIPNTVVNTPQAIAQAQRIILPGVGAFAHAMDSLRQLDLEAPVRQAVARGVPLLGVCVGMQLLFAQSEEDGLHQGLGFIPGRVVRFALPTGGPHKIPQIGWNQVAIQPEHQTDPLLEGIADGSYFYFVHSYHAVTQARYTLGTTHYGEDFPAIVRGGFEHGGNVWGVQFHPEKSQDAGLRLLNNFAQMAL